MFDRIKSNQDGGENRTIRQAELSICHRDYDCGVNNYCEPKSSKCRCIFGYARPTLDACCREINCSSNVDCLRDFTNVKCVNTKCECDDSHYLDTRTQTCVYMGGNSPTPATYVLIGAFAMLLFILIFAGTAICVLRCRASNNSLDFDRRTRRSRLRLRNGEPRSTSNQSSNGYSNPFFLNHSSAYAHFENPLHQFCDTENLSHSSHGRLSSPMPQSATTTTTTTAATTTTTSALSPPTPPPRYRQNSGDDHHNISTIAINASRNRENQRNHSNADFLFFDRALLSSNISREDDLPSQQQQSPQFCEISIVDRRSSTDSLDHVGSRRLPPISRKLNIL